MTATNLSLNLRIFESWSDFEFRWLNCPIWGVNTMDFLGQNQGNLWELKGSFFLDLTDRTHNCQTTGLKLTNDSSDE